MAQHEHLRHEFMNLETTIVKDSDDSKYNEYYSCRQNIELRKPPKLHVLDILCHNEVVAACYDGEEKDNNKKNVKFLPRITCQLIAWPNIGSDIDH